MGNKSKEDQQPAGVLSEHELRAFVHREIDGGRLRCVFGYGGDAQAHWADTQAANV